MTELDPTSTASYYASIGKTSDCGHGHVWPNANGMKARCGGPGLCSKCSIDKVAKDNAATGENARVAAELRAALPPPAAGEGLEPVAAYHLVFDGFPSPDGPRFIELEDDNGRSFRGGEWVSRSDGLTELVLPRATPAARAAVLEALPAAFITSTSDSPRYYVTIKTETLEGAQRWHDAVLSLAGPQQ